MMVKETKRPAYEAPRCISRNLLYDSGLATSSTGGEAGLEPFDDWGDYQW